MSDDVSKDKKKRLPYSEKYMKRLIDDILHDDFFATRELGDISMDKKKRDEGYEKFKRDNKKLLDILADIGGFFKSMEESKTAVFGVIHNTLKVEEDLNKFILKRYIKEGMEEEFSDTILSHERFPASLKVDIAIRSGLLRKYGYKGVENDLMQFFKLRNIVAHSRRDHKRGSAYLKRMKAEISLKTAVDEFLHIMIG